MAKDQIDPPHFDANLWMVKWLASATEVNQTGLK